MKYFTPELINRTRSADDDVADAAHDDWELAIKRSNRHWRRIRLAVPENVRRFDEGSVCLHDAELLSMGRQDDQLVMLLETEPPASKPVVLTFTLEEAPAIQTGTLTGARQGKPIYWAYEEWDLDRQKRPTLEVLLSNGSVLKLVFRDFHYLVAEPLLPSANGQAAYPTARRCRARPDASRWPSELSCRPAGLAANATWKTWRAALPSLAKDSAAAETRTTYHPLGCPGAHSAGG